MHRPFALTILATLVVQIAAGAPDTTREAIETTLAAMERAVLAGDAETYLAHVAAPADDPWFVAEQRHWADDLKRVAPDAFDLAIGDGPSDFGRDRAEFQLIMRWTMDGGRDWDVSWPAVFVRDGDAWLYRGQRWNELPGDGFVVKYADGLEDTAREVAEAFPLARAHVDEGFELADGTGPQVIKLYKEQPQIVASVYLGAMEWIPGWYEPGESIKFLYTYTRGEGWRTAFAHEYGHTATFALGPERWTIPWWVAEGVAQLATEGFDAGVRDRVDGQVRRWAEAGDLADWNDLADMKGTEPRLVGHVYTQGHHMVGYISSRWGRAGRNAWLTAMANGAELDEATRTTLGMPFAELDQAWHESIDRGPEAAAAVADVLSQMTSAVLAGEPDAYMRNVCESDAIFVQEQRMWAKDLLEHTPTAFELKLTGPAVYEGPRVRCDLRMTWTLTEGAEARSVAYPVLFERAGDDQSVTWRYAGEAWHVVTADGLAVMHLGRLQNPAEGVVEIWPEVRDHVVAMLETTPEATQQVKLYDTMQHLQSSIYLSYTDGLGGWNEPGESIKILSNPDQSGRGLRVVLAHEFGHAVTFAMGEHAGRMPWWTLEGVAQLCAEEFSGGGRRIDGVMRRWSERGRLVEWEKLADFRGEAQQHTGAVYSQGHHMLRYITEQFGGQKRNQWLRLMARGADLNEATERALGRTFAELDAQWRDSLRPTEEPVDDDG